MRAHLIKLLATREWTCGLCDVSLKKEVWELVNYYSYLYRDKPIKPLKKRRLINIDIDHIEPRSKGGVNEIFNLQLTHSHCNNKKGNET